MPTTYTEREVAQIIERAVVRQEETRRREGAAGLSLDEIERLGREVGIDPEHLRAAAAEVDAGAAQHSAHTTTTHNHVERWTTGPLDPIAWEDTVEDLRHRLGTDYGPMFGRTSSGQVVETGATKTWEHTSGLGVHTRLVVSERGDRTRLRIAQQVGSASTPVEAGVYGLLSMVLLGPLAGLTGAALFDGTVATVTSLILGLVLLVGASMAAYRLDVAWRAKKHRQLTDLADDLAAGLAAEGARPARGSETRREASDPDASDSETAGWETDGPDLGDELDGELDGEDAAAPHAQTARRARS